MFFPPFSGPLGGKNASFFPPLFRPLGGKTFYFPPIWGEKSPPQAKIFENCDFGNARIPYENAFQKGKSAVERKKFRLRRARSSIRSFVYRYIRNTLFLHVNKQISPPQAPIFLEFFPPILRTPGGKKTFFPPLSGPLGGKRKKRFPPIWQETRGGPKF